MSAGIPMKTRGSLYAIGDDNGFYPALVLGTNNDTWVEGQYFTPLQTFTQADMQTLDGYENFRPDMPSQSDYLRRIISLKTASGEVKEAQAYVYQKPLPENAIYIENGNFLSFIQDNGLSFYKT